MPVDSSSKYQEPVDVRERTRFFDGQFLVDYDFIRDQVYHIDQQRNHNKTLHVSGVANGLQVSGGANYQVTVTAGTAIDQNGRQIILAADCPLDVRKLGIVDGATSGTSYLHLAYNQAPATYAQADQQGLKGQPRWVELPCLFCYISSSGDPLRAGDNYPAVNNWAVAAAYCAQQQSGTGLSDNATDWQWTIWTATAPPPLLLAKLTIDDSGNVNVEDKRTYAGLHLPSPDEIFLRVQHDSLFSTNASSGIGFWLAQSGSEPTLRLSLANDGSLGVRANVPSLLRLENSEGNGSEVHIDLATYGSGTAPPLDPSARISALDDLNFSNHIAFFTKQSGASTNRLAERLRLTSDGKVGIGTDKPVEKLTISGGNIQLDGGQQLCFADGDTSNNLKVQLWNGYGLGINEGTLFYAANGRHSWRDASGANERMGLTTGADGGLTVSGTGNSSFAGKLGIGTTSPASTLSVNGGVAIGADYASGSAAPTNGLIVQGNVGIGTTSPSALLDINGTLKVTKIGIRTDSPTIDLAIGDNDTGLTQKDDGQLAIYTNSFERVRIDPVGRVGIGTQTPNYHLQIGYGDAQIHLGDDTNWGEINRWANRLQVRSSDYVTVAVGDVTNDVVSVSSNGVNLNGNIQVSGSVPMTILRYDSSKLSQAGDKDDSSYYDTGFSVSSYSAAIIGFKISGDIDETGRGKNGLIFVTMNKNNPTWLIEYLLQSDSDVNWVVDVMFIRKELVSDNR